MLKFLLIPDRRVRYNRNGSLRTWPIDGLKKASKRIFYRPSCTCSNKSSIILK